MVNLDMEVLLNKIKELSKEKDTKSIEETALKLSEETGEVSQAVLSSLKVTGTEYKHLTKEDVKEENIDVILVAFSLLYKLGCDNDEIVSIMSKKISKWSSILNKKDVES